MRELRQPEGVAGHAGLHDQPDAPELIDAAEPATDLTASDHLVVHRDLRILHVVTLVDEDCSYGGPLTVAINQCRELRRQGHDARIVAGWRGEDMLPRELEGVPAHLFPVRSIAPGVKAGRVSLAMLSWLRANAADFDAAHVHLSRDLVPVLVARRLAKAGVPYVTQTHGMVMPDRRVRVRMLDRILTLPAIARASTKFVLSDAEDAGMVNLLSPVVHTQRLRHGIAIARGEVGGAVPLQSRTAELDVLFMARLHPRKRVMDFAVAARNLLLEGHNLRFTVIGPDGGDLADLETFIEDSASELSGRLVYGGALEHEQAMKRLRKADIFVLPSVTDPFPITLLEALAAGTPSICTTECGISGELRDAEAALVVDPGPEMLTAALRALVASPQRRAALSAAGPRCARARFSISRVAEQLLVAYRQEQEALI